MKVKSCMGKILRRMEERFKTVLRVLTFNGVYIPGYKAGGPIRSLANLASHLKDDVQLYVLTTDRDAGDAAPYNGIEVNKWVKLSYEFVYYQKKGGSLALAMLKLINIHLKSRK